MDASLPNTELAFPIFDLLGILVCLITSAIFSGTETALTRIPDAKAHQLYEADPDHNGLYLHWLTHRRLIVSALLVGNNLVNIIASVLGYRVAAYAIPQYAEVVSVGMLTLLLLLFGEITPKSFAMQYWEKLSGPLLRLAWVFEKLFYVVAWPLERVPILLFGRPQNALETPQVTEDDIEFQIRLGVQEQVFEEKGQGELLRSVVEFPETLVKEAMTPRTDVFSIDVTTPFQEALHKLLAEGHSRIPVYKEDFDNIVGILHIRDLLEPLAGSPDAWPETIEPLMHEPFFAPETQKVSELLSLMKKQAQHMAIVVDEFGGTAGIITLEDIIEELVGDIRDEYDDEEDSPHVVKIDEGLWVVDARMSIYDLRDTIGVMLPDTGEYESLGGFVVAAHGTIPEPGEVIMAPGAKITVISSDARRVEKCEIRLISEPVEE